MKVLLGLRVLLALLVAGILPLAQAHCACPTAHPAEPSAVHAAHHDEDDDGCCEESASHSASSTTACCCDNLQIPAATSSASIAIESLQKLFAPLATVPVHAIVVVNSGTLVAFEPNARSGSPPDPSAAAQSPRSPPRSA